MPTPKPKPTPPMLLLPADATSVAEPQVFGAAIPGAYTPGEAAPLPADWTLADAEAAIAAHHLPLVVVKGDA